MSSERSTFRRTGIGAFDVLRPGSAAAAFARRPRLLSRWLHVGITVGALLALSAGCRQDMADQPRADAFEASDFFADGRASRPVVAGTVARGQLRDDPHFFTGKVNGQLASTFPGQVKLDRALLLRGQDRFNVFCQHCHGPRGEGNGMIVQRGFRQPNSYHVDRLRAAPPGYFFDVITNGYGTMFDLADRVPPADRWAIAAYIRVLQLSQNATQADIPADQLGHVGTFEGGVYRPAGVSDTSLPTGPATSTSGRAHTP